MLQLYFFVRHYIKKKKKSIIQSIILWNMNLKSSQINCDQNKNVFQHKPERRCAARPRRRPRVRLPTRGPAPARRRAVKPGAKAKDSFLLGERLWVSTGPHSSHSADTRERRVSSGSPRTARPRLHLPERPAPLADTAGSRELNFRKVP